MPSPCVNFVCKCYQNNTTLRQQPLAMLLQRIPQHIQICRREVIHIQMVEGCMAAEQVQLWYQRVKLRTTPSASMDILLSGLVRLPVTQSHLNLT